MYPGILTAVFSILLLNAVPMLRAQETAPHFVSYQGVLTDSSGAPKADGDYSVTFNYYVDSTDIVPLASVTKTVTVAQGLFSTQLSLDSLSSAPYFLGLEVGSGREMSPRIRLTSTIYSFLANYCIRAETASYVNSYGVRDISADAITHGTLADSLLDEDLQDLADGSLTGSKVGSGIDASNITTGILAPARLSGINADSISTGTITDDRLETVIDRTVFNASDYMTAAGGINVGGTSDPGDGNLYASGGVGIGTSANTGHGLDVDVSGDSKYYGIYVTNNYSGSTSKMGTRNWISTDGTGSRYGTYNYVYSNTDGDNAYGTYNYMRRSGYAGDAYGVYNYFYGTANSGTEYGFYTAGEDMNYFSGDVGIGDGTPSYKLDVSGDGHFTTGLTVDGEVGVGSDPASYYSMNVSSATDHTVGVYVDQNYTGTSGKYGVYSYVDAAGTGTRYGMYTTVYSNTADASNCYGIYASMYQNTSDAPTYALRLYSYGSGAGTKYGVYSAGEDKNYFSGDVNIGYNSTGTYRLYVSGTAYCSAGSWTASDRRWKKNITPLSNGLDKIMRLEGVTYDWRKDEFPEKNFIDGTQVGLISQDVEKVVPEVVSTDTDGYKAVAYDKLVAVLIEAVKEQQTQIEELRSWKNASETELQQTRMELNDSKNEIQELKDRMDAVESVLKGLAGQKNGR